MASLAPLTAPQRAPRSAPRPAPRPARRPPQTRPRPAARPRVAGGVVWIVLVALSLAGIVALNVAVLRLNMQAERLDLERQELSSQHDVLSSELSRAAAASRIETIAGRKLGLERPVETSYVRLGRPKR